MAIYKTFKINHFQRWLIQIRNNSNGTYKGYEDVSEELSKNWSGNPISEYIYELKTFNPAVSFLIFTSISKIDNEARQVGTDRVRIVKKWKMKKQNRILYIRIGRLNRAEGLKERFTKIMEKECGDIKPMRPKDDWSENLIEKL